MNIDYQTLSKRISDLRRKKGLTQESLAEKTELSSNYISHIENSRSIPSLETLMKLCSALDITPDEVLRLPNEELLCIIRGHNILKLTKLDFTRHPMAKQIVKASVYDYKPAADTLTPTPTQSDTEPTPLKKAARKKSLYSSAQPPSEF